MSWKNVRLTDGKNNRTIFGNLDFYTDGTIHVTGNLSLADKAKASAKTIAKHPVAALSVAGTVIKACAGVPSPVGAYMMTKRLKEASHTYQQEKDSLTVLKGVIENIGRLRARLDEKEGTVYLTGDSRRYTIYFQTRFVARTFAEAFRTEAKKYPGS